MFSPPSTLLETVRDWMQSFPTGSDHRLPPERELAEKFAVGRGQLRTVLAELEKEGLIERFVGRGTFVVGARTNGSRDPENIAAASSPVAAMQARGIIEPEIARLAAYHANSNQIEQLRDLCRRMRQAETWEIYAELDWQFHNLLAEATTNTVLQEVQKLVNGIRRFVVWGALTKRPVGPQADYHSFDEHEKIVEAIANRDGHSAAQAMLDHLGGTSSHIVDFKRTTPRS